MKIPRFIVGLLILILITLSASAKTQDDPSGDLANSLLTRAYEYRLKGRFQNAETILRYGIKILSLEKEGQVGAASLKIELARVIIRKTFHINTSDKEAIALYRNVFHFANENNNKKLIGKALYGIGFYEFKAGSDSWDKALRNLEESLKVRREIDDSFGISQSLFTIGTIYQRRGQNKQATRVYRESLGFARKAKSDYMEGENQRHIGYTHLLRGDFKKALLHFSSSLEKRREIGYTDGEMFALITIGQTYQRLEDFDNAKLFLKKGLEIAKRMDSKVGKTRAYAALGKLFYDKKEKRNAFVSLNRAEKLADDYGFATTKKNVRELLLKLEKQ